MRTPTTMPAIAPPLSAALRRVCDACAEFDVCVELRVCVELGFCVELEFCVELGFCVKLGVGVEDDDVDPQVKFAERLTRLPPEAEQQSLDEPQHHVADSEVPSQGVMRTFPRFTCCLLARRDSKNVSSLCVCASIGIASYSLHPRKH